MNKPATNRLILIALLPAALLLSSVQASAAQMTPAIVGASKTQTLFYDALYTEANWQRVQLPTEAMQRLGSLQDLTLQVSGLPPHVSVTLSGKAGPGGATSANSVGLAVSRSDTSRPVHQMGTFTLSNPASGQSLTFQAMVTGSGR